MDNVYKFIGMYKDRLARENRKEKPDPETIEFLKNKIKELKKEIR